MDSRIIFDSVVVGFQIGVFLCLGIVMMLAGKQKEKYTRRIHLLIGLFGCVIAFEYALPSVFWDDTVDLFYHGIASAYTTKLSFIILQADCLLSYPLLAMILFSLYQAYKPIPFKTILFPLVIPVALLVWSIIDFKAEIQTIVYNIFWIVYAAVTVISFIANIGEYRKYCNDNYSDTSSRSLKWLAGIPVIAIPVIVFDRFVYASFQNNLILAIASELSILPVFLYLAYFAHKQTPADQSDDIPEKSLHIKPKDHDLQLSDEMRQIFTTLLEEKCVLTQAYLTPQLTRSQLSVLLGTNNTYISRYFASVGTNFNEYINGLRLDYACRLIKEARGPEDISLKSIAQSSGFVNYQTFARIFVKRFGVSPTDWCRENFKTQI